MPGPSADLRAKPSDAVGTLVLDNAPLYHGLVVVHWTLVKRPYFPTLGVFLSQGGRWVYIAELSIPKDATGSSSQIVLASEVSSALPGRIDYSQPSDGQAFIWDERLVSQGKPAAMTNQVFFTVPAEVYGK